MRRFLWSAFLFIVGVLAVAWVTVFLLVHPANPQAYNQGETP